jgi:hypothetical protein
MLLDSVKKNLKYADFFSLNVKLVPLSLF